MKIQLGNFIRKNCSHILTEAIRNRDIEKALKVIRNYLNRKGVYLIEDIIQFNQEGKSYFVLAGFNDEGMGCTIQWDRGDSSAISAISFTKDFDAMISCMTSPKTENFKFDVWCQILGANTAKCIELIADVMNGKVDMDFRSIATVIKDYNMYEDQEELNSNLITEDRLAELTKKRKSLYHIIRYNKRMGKDLGDLEDQYAEIKKEIEDIRTNVKPNSIATITPELEMQKACSLLEEEERATPEERFSDMESYIQMVIDKEAPLALICGAPGVGKSYRIEKLLNKNGLYDEEGFKLMSGKCTPTSLFTELFQWKEPGQIIFFDDCDSIFRDDDAINILKAAYDSKNTRRVSWNILKPILCPSDVVEKTDPESLYYDAVTDKWYYPKKFVYEGGGIIATNYRAGQIDTAVRNRALICDLDFTVTEILGLIKDIVGKTMTKYSEEVKDQAYDFLLALGESGADCELSVRSFGTCCKIFTSDAPEKSKMRRVRELMRLQFQRGGKKH